MPAPIRVLVLSFILILSSFYHVTRELQPTYDPIPYPWITRPGSFLFNPLHRGSHSFREKLDSVRPEEHSRTLGVADSIYVISLKRRMDRRETMDSIARALELDFTYIDATDFSEPETNAMIQRIIDRVRWQRSRLDENPTPPPEDIPVPDHETYENFILHAFPFQWSEEVVRYSEDPLGAPLGFGGADYWEEEEPDVGWSATHRMPEMTDETRVLEENKVLTAGGYNDLNVHETLPKAAVSCWHSHVKALREIVRKREILCLLQSLYMPDANEYNYFLQGKKQE